MTSCGVCVCPTPIQTAPPGDLCTVVNSTHAICAYGFTTSNYSWFNAFVAGVTVTLIIIGLIIVTRHLTGQKEQEPPNGN